LTDETGVHQDERPLYLGLKVGRCACKIKSGDMRGGFGFSEAYAQEKQFLRAGFRPENL